MLLILLPVIAAAQQPAPGSDSSETIASDIDTSPADNSEDNQTDKKTCPLQPQRRRF